MARFNPNHDVSRIYPLTKRWVRDCLVADGSLFSEGSLWTASSVHELVEAFVRHPLLTPNTNFLEKLKDQLSSSVPDVKRLMAEFLFILTLFQTNMRPATKRELVRTVWSWSGNALRADHPCLDDLVLEGIGSPGTAYLTHRWRELAYFIQIVAALKDEPNDRRAHIVSDPDTFAQWLDAIPTVGYRQFRNILVHLAFPDAFERITVQSQKREIVQAFSALAREKIKSATEYDLDLALRALRDKLATERGTLDIDFYDGVLRPRWQSATAEKPTSARAWLLSWNPHKWDWTTFAQDRFAAARGNTVAQSWRCHNSRVASGDRVFLVRAGDEPRGVIARGTALSPPYETKHYDPSKAAAGERQFSIDVEFDDIRDPQQDSFLRTPELETLSAEQHWTPQQSGIELRSEVIPLLEQAWARLPRPTLEESRLPSSEPAQPYTADDILADGCFQSASQIDAILSSWRSKKNLVLQGPPGTGKTWLAKRLAYALIGYGDDRRIVSVQFHPNLSYEDFVRGWRPGKDGRLDLVDGIFLVAVAAARKEPGVPFVLVIEEVNRGNPAQIFGEILTLMEDSKRDPREAMRLAYPREEEERVYLPDNLFIIGTMNIADRSLALVDLALRRRFAFVDLEPQLNERWEKWLVEKFDFDDTTIRDIRDRVEALNHQIAGDDQLGPQFQIGHSYVTPSAGGSVDDPRAWFRQVVETQIGPLLHEYWFDDRGDKAKRASEQLLKDM